MPSLGRLVLLNNEGGIEESAASSNKCIRIGTSGKCELVLPNLDSLHAIITISVGKARIINKSTDIITVGGKRVHKNTLLPANCIIQIKDHKLEWTYESTNVLNKTAVTPRKFDKRQPLPVPNSAPNLKYKSGINKLKNTVQPRKTFHSHSFAAKTLNELSKVDDSDREASTFVEDNTTTNNTSCLSGVTTFNDTATSAQKQKKINLTLSPMMNWSTGQKKTCYFNNVTDTLGSICGTPDTLVSTNTSIGGKIHTPGQNSSICLIDLTTPMNSSRATNRGLYKSAIENSVTSNKKVDRHASCRLDFNPKRISTPTKSNLMGTSTSKQASSSIVRARSLSRTPKQIKKPLNVKSAIKTPRSLRRGLSVSFSVKDAEETTDLNSTFVVDEEENDSQADKENAGPSTVNDLATSVRVLVTPLKEWSNDRVKFHHNLNSSYETEQTVLDDNKKDIKNVSTDFNGMKDMLKTPLADKSTMLYGIRELVQTPSNADVLVNLVGVKELMNTPKVNGNANDNLVGMKELMQIPANTKENIENINLVGVKELMKTPSNSKENIENINLVGVKELMKTPSNSKNNTNLVGVKELMKTPSNTKDNTNLVGVRELMKTPSDQNEMENFVGVKELVNTPHNVSINFVGVRDLMNTPKLDNENVNLVGVKELVKTPKKNNDTIELIDDIIFDSPEQKQSSEESDNIQEEKSENSTETDKYKDIDKVFDDLVGLPSVNVSRTYGSSEKKRQSVIDNLTSTKRKDIENWALSTTLALESDELSMKAPDSIKQSTHKRRLFDAEKFVETSPNKSLESVEMTHTASSRISLMSSPLITRPRRAAARTAKRLISQTMTHEVAAEKLHKEAVDNTISEPVSSIPSKRNKRTTSKMSEPNVAPKPSSTRGRKKKASDNISEQNEADTPNQIGEEDKVLTKPKRGTRNIVMTEEISQNIVQDIEVIPAKRVTRKASKLNEEVTKPIGRTRKRKDSESTVTSEIEKKSSGKGRTRKLTSEKESVVENESSENGPTVKTTRGRKKTTNIDLGEINGDIIEEKTTKTKRSKVTPEPIGIKNSPPKRVLRPRK